MRRNHSPLLAIGGFLFAALAAHCANRPADLVVLHGKILTVDPAFRVVSAVAIKDGVFVAVGTDEKVRAWVGPNTRIIDAGGRAVIPGLNETHVHATEAALKEVQGGVPFRQLFSIGEIQDWVRERAKAIGPGRWIQLPRVDVTRIKERRLPNRADLDAAAPNNPVVYLWQYATRTKQILNSAALRAAHITKDTVPPPAHMSPHGEVAPGKIYLSPDGEPTGVMDNCDSLVAKFLTHKYSREKYLDALAELMRRYNQVGITSITERYSGMDGYRDYEALRAQGRLPVRVIVTFGLEKICNPNTSTEAEMEKAIRALPFKSGDGDDWLRVGPLKVIADGGILYGTAFMREPYGRRAFSLLGISDPNYRGRLLISADNLKKVMRAGNRAGWQMASHVTGNAGVDAILDAVEAANADKPIVGRRYNLIHAYFADPETAKRAARLGVCIDTQPAWYYRDGDALADALGADRMAKFIGLKTWLDAGLKVAINSDHMMGFDPNMSANPYNPFLAMQTAITRKTDGGQIFGADQRVSREQALRMTTIDAAYLSFNEKRKGSIEVGKLGDLAILSGDPMTCPEDHIMDLRAWATIVGGKVVLEPPFTL